MKFQHGWAFPDVDEFMVNELKADGSYQGAHLDAALTHVTDFSVAIDGGAHVGTWSRPLSARFARVIAVEPSPDTFEALQRNLEVFGCLNVEARNVAIGAAAGSISMVLDGRGAALANTGARYVHPKGTIALEPIDAWKLRSLGFLKLDVEGSELAALTGARQTLLRCRPIVLFENKKLWRRFGAVDDAPQQFLMSLRYRQRERVGCDLIWGPA